MNSKKVLIPLSTAVVLSMYLGSYSTSALEPTDSTTNETQQVALTTSATGDYRYCTASALYVRASASLNGTIVGTLYKGDQVEVIEEISTDIKWAKIKYNGSEAYASSGYLSSPTPSGQNTETNTYNSLNFSLEDYVNTQIGKNVISKGSGFVTALISDLMQYADPTFVTSGRSSGMYQFLKLDTYRPVNLTKLNQYLNSLTPKTGNVNIFQDKGQAFIDAAQNYNIDPIYLVAHTMLETGYGQSSLAQGYDVILDDNGNAVYYSDNKYVMLKNSFTLPDVKTVKVYNLFGIGAVDSAVIPGGTTTAYKEGWMSIDKAIEGSAQWISSRYINSATHTHQYTLYSMKWDYINSWHQYATDVGWPIKIANNIENLSYIYENAKLDLEIPKYASSPYAVPAISNIISTKYVSSGDIPIKAFAGDKYTTLGSFNQGEKVDIYGYTSNNWIIVKYNGNTGYLSPTHASNLNLKVESVNATVDKPSPVPAGTPLTITASSKGSSNPAYKFFVLEDGVWKVIQDYSISNKATWTPTKAGQYKISVHAKDASSASSYESYYAFDYTAKQSKVESISATADKVSPVPAGTPITITASSKGSSNPMYRFYVLDDGVWKLLQDYSNKNTLTWTPSKAGNYKFSIHAKDAKSSASYELFYAFDYTVKLSKVDSISATIDKASPVSAGTPITVTASSKGSSNPVYRFYVLEDGVWKLAQDYSSKNTLTWTPAKAGNYKFSIHAKDVNSSANYESYYAFEYTVNKPLKVESVSAISNKPSTVTVGTPITITASSKGSSTPIYKFNVLEDGVWKVAQDYSSNNKLTWTSSKAGKYKFSIHAKDVNSSANYESYYAFEYTVTNSLKVESVNATVDKTSPISTGTPLTITASSIGGTNPVYRFYVLEDGVWKLAQDYSSNNTLTWTPSKSGNYKFSIHAKDVNSSANYESYYAFEYTVN